MKSFAKYLVVAVVLAVAGGVCWLMGEAERQVVTSRVELLTMRYADAAEDAAPDASMRYAQRLPGVGATIGTEMRDDRATADYWLARYDALKRPPKADDERDPRILLLVANAAYRAVQGDPVDRASAVRQLNEIVKIYADVMKRTSGAEREDAAYNYELAIRRREDLARQRGSTPVKIGFADSAPTIHGQSGGPPKGVAMSQFKVLVPKRSDERQESPEAGQSGNKKRKG